MSDRELPSNIEAEQSLLGSILMNNDAYFRVVDIVAPEHFHEPAHRVIFEAIAKFIKVGKLADAVTLKMHLPADLMEGMTMARYLGVLLTAPPTIINAPDYARAVRDAADKRGLLLISDQMAYEAVRRDTELSANQQIEEAEKALHELAKTGQAGREFKSFGAVVTEAVDNAAAAYQRDGRLSGLASGFHDLDRLMGGLQASDLIVLAGRPAMGKTAFATNIAFHIASHFTAGEGDKAKNGGRVAFFSLEMSGEQLATRILSEQAGIPSSAIRRGDIHENQFSKVVDVAQRISSMPLWVDDTGGVTVHQLAAKARRMKRQRHIDLVVIDYLQLIAGSRRNSSDNRVNEITEITTTLKALAKELQVPIIALSQLSRQVENREDKRPQLSDLRESGSIEQDADVVLFVYRDEYYLSLKEPKEGTAEHDKWSDEMSRVAGRAEVIVGKQRHGPTGLVPMAFDANLTKFSDLVKTAFTAERRSA